MDCYRVIKEVGDGTFGCVWRAVNKFTGEVVAIKKMKKKYYTWEECMNLREVKSLRMMEHPNIVKLKEVIREHDILYLVFEYMELDLYQLMKDRTKLFSEAEIRSWCFQVFHALAYMHHRGCFHRDLKPENLLVTKDIIKVADFGLAREVCSKPPYTEYVSTRWYRAPEVLLQSPIYGAEVDMWAMGAIMAELFTLRPLFPGSSEVFELSHPDGIQSEFHYDSRDLFPASGAGNDSEVDEIYKICSVIGSPNQNSWAEGLRLANEMKYQFPQSSGVPLSALIPSASEDAVSLITILCSWDPRRRPSAAEALQHPFFQPCHYYVPPSLRPRATGTTHHTSPSVGTKEAVEQRNAGRRYSLGALSANYTCAIPIVKPAINFTKANTSLQAGVQRKLEMDYQGTEKNNEKTAKTRAQRPQPRYQPPLRNNNPGSAHPRRPPVRVSEAASKLGQMTLGGPAPRPPQAEWRQQEVPPPMKAGGWHGQPDLLGRPHEIPAAARTAPRKVVS